MWALGRTAGHLRRVRWPRRRSCCRRVASKPRGGTTCIDVMGARGDDATSVGAVGVLLQVQPAATTRAVHSTTSRRDDAEMEVIPFLRCGGTLVDICSGCERHAPESILVRAGPDHGLLHKDVTPAVELGASSTAAYPHHPIDARALRHQDHTAVPQYHGRGTAYGTDRRLGTPPAVEGSRRVDHRKPPWAATNCQSFVSQRSAPRATDWRMTGRWLASRSSGRAIRGRLRRCYGGQPSPES